MDRGIYDRAIEFAVGRYGGALRKDNATPVLVHALRVVEILRRVANVTSDGVLSAALLHDVLEDTSTNREEIDQAVGREVTELVAALTEDKRLRKSERKAEMLRRFPELPRDAQLVKLADRLDNVTSPWLRGSPDVAQRYIGECEEMLREANGTCLALEKALAQQLGKLAALRR